MDNPESNVLVVRGCEWNGINFSRKYADVTQFHFKHTLLINDLRVLLEKERNTNEHFTYIDENTFLKPKARPKKTWYACNHKR